MYYWNISDRPNDSNRRALREIMPSYLKELFDCCRCDERLPGNMSRNNQNLFRHPEAVPFFHETADYASGRILFLFLCPNVSDMRSRRRMCTDFWRWWEQRGLARASDWTNLYFHELLCAQFGLFQDQVVTMNAVLCAPPDDDDPNKPHERQMKNCLETLVARVNVIGPHIVIALGQEVGKALKNVGIPVPSWPGPNGSWSNPVRWRDTSFDRWVFIAPHPAAAKQGGYYRLHQMHKIWGNIRDGINELTTYRLSTGVPADLACPETESQATDDNKEGLAYLINQNIRAEIEKPLSSSEHLHHSRVNSYPGT